MYNFYYICFADMDSVENQIGQKSSLTFSEQYTE